MSRMSSEVVMPRMGLTMESGTIVHWLKQEGETVAVGEPLLEIETDKATVEIEAMESGTLQKIVANVGDEIPIGGIIAYIGKVGEAAQQEPSAVAQASQTPAASLELSPQVILPAASHKVRASPAARKLARSLGVDISDVRGSGPNGRIVAWNVTDVAEAATKVQAAPAEQSPVRVSPVAQRVAAEKGLDLSEVQGSGPGGTITRRDVELAAQSSGIAASTTTPAELPTVTPLTRVQRVMAERMAHSFGTAPHFYLHTEVDARQLVALREQLLPRLEQSDQVHITFTDVLIYFCSRILPRHPLVMAEWSPEGLKEFRRVHLGIAVEAENGLLVPVIRDADRLGLVDLARKRADLSERARRGKLLPDEFEEGVFTISNLGMYRIDSFDAILNPTQAAILAVGRIQERALVENGQVVPASMMNLSLSVDHRVLDGSRAARFLSELADVIETPGLSMR
jgi:pyruvate dehydrogenase E2 component (dihydrolipoamide acetyltransferase)